MDTLQAFLYLCHQNVYLPFVISLLGWTVRWPRDFILRSHETLPHFPVHETCAPLGVPFINCLDTIGCFRFWDMSPAIKRLRKFQIPCLLDHEEHPADVGLDYRWMRYSLCQTITLFQPG